MIEVRWIVEVMSHTHEMPEESMPEESMPGESRPARKIIIEGLQESMD